MNLNVNKLNKIQVLYHGYSTFPHRATSIQKTQIFNAQETKCFRRTLYLVYIFVKFHGIPFVKAK